MKRGAGGSVQFRTPTAAAWAGGERQKEGGEGGLYLRLLEAFLQFPVLFWAGLVHIRQSGGTISFRHSPQKGNRGEMGEYGGEFCAPVHRGQQMRPSRLFFIVHRWCGLGGGAEGGGVSGPTPKPPAVPRRSRTNTRQQRSDFTSLSQAIINQLLSNLPTSAFLAQERVPDHLVDMPYRDVFAHLARHNMVALGLYRYHGAENLPFVYTNPPQDTVVQQEDMVFVVRRGQPSL